MKSSAIEDMIPELKFVFLHSFKWVSVNIEIEADEIILTSKLLFHSMNNLKYRFGIASELLLDSYLQTTVRVL